MTEDPNGTVVENLEQARSEAMESARELLAVSVKAGRIIDGQAFEVTDEAGKLVFSYPFKDAVKLP